MDELSESRKRANKKWNDASKAKMRTYQLRSQAKKCIREFARKKDDLKELREMIDERLKKF
ncbi:hypothetical protein [Limosilactobacillus equigenerosi]|uniref:Uncharacterized protein n=1 Tax=Limosilactobacillus equigenerosi DSM 18793 = JCM 14505 TaxID=1423742 RepID=A0A0R1UND1_9LACO|nr:hypothetical protein [Limosilactobacillus equigenerosi]KRL94685.1 hypothetical protein FC21_GL001302 [Limosilactobacillus equigenerosi DSM 18793 = JCM 14505]